MTSGKDDAAANQVTFPANRYWIFAAIAVLGLLIDLLTKWWIFGLLWPPVAGQRPVIWIWQPHFGLEVTLNEGALFGMGQGLVWLFVVLSLVAAVGVVYWLFVAGEARDLWLTCALGAISAGILGNLYDRIGLHGVTWPAAFGPARAGQPAYAVRDWILFQWNDALRWPNFNIADSLLVCGAIMLLLHAFRPQPTEKTKASPGALR
ncbi:MAG: signal peptidase II [Planctomycetota bacterium]|nr:signal peptidase II [Planctomycetota bacterium]